MSRSPRASAAPGSGCRRSSSSRAPWAATSSSTPRHGGGTTFTLSVTLSPRQGAGGADVRRRWRVSRDRRAALRAAQRRGQSVRPRRAQRDPDRTRSSGRIHRPRRGRRRADRARRLRRGADGHGVAGHQRHRGDPANPRAGARRSAASRSSAYRAAARTRRHRAPPAPIAFLVKPVSPRALATALLEATRRAAAAT